jgi:hypothetical protein
VTEAALSFAHQRIPKNENHLGIMVVGRHGGATMQQVAHEQLLLIGGIAIVNRCGFSKFHAGCGMQVLPFEQQIKLHSQPCIAKRYRTTAVPLVAVAPLNGIAMIIRWTCHAAGLSRA